MGMTRQERVSLHKKQERLQVGKGAPSVSEMKEGVPELRYVEGTGLTEYTRFNNVLHENVLDKSNVKEVVKDNICFSLYASAAQANIATGSDVTIVFGGEEFDLNGNCASNTFTSPVNGKYFLHTNLGLNQIDAVSPGGNYYLLKIVTSNRNYESWTDDKDFTADTGYHTISLTAIADMDAGHTAHVTLKQESGNAQTDILFDGNNEPSRCYFTGYLIAAV